MKFVATGVLGLALLVTGCSGANQPNPSQQPPIVVSQSPAASSPAEPAPTAVAPTATATAATQPTSPAVTPEAPGAELDLATQTGFVAPEQAMQRAAAHVTGTLHHLELEYSSHHRAWVYQVEIQVGAVDHELTLDAATGELLQRDTDSEDGAERAIDLGAMSPEAALRAAQAVKAGSVSEWKLGWDDGALVYEVSIRDGKGTAEVRVDPATGRATLDD